MRDKTGSDMASKANQLITFFQKHNGTVRFSAVLKEGFHPDTLTTLEKDGKIEKIGRGLYRLSDLPTGSYRDLVSACLQVPNGVICLISALSFYEVTTEVPRCVDLAIPRESRSRRIKYPPVKFYRFASRAWEAGIEKHKIENQNVLIYSLAKTIADCFKFRNKIGADLARTALKTAVLEKRTSPNEIMQYAKICRVGKIIQPILESLL
jgi:predicted transcriptional regulator of viral defense system